MSSGMHARGDRSFGRSAGTQTLKGAGLLAIAVIIGIVLLHTAPANITTVSAVVDLPADDEGAEALDHDATTVTQAPLSTTTTAPPTHPPAQVKVAVANGSGVPGLAGRLRVQLNSAGVQHEHPGAERAGRGAGDHDLLRGRVRARREGDRERPAQPPRDGRQADAQPVAGAPGRNAGV